MTVFDPAPIREALHDYDPDCGLSPLAWWDGLQNFVANAPSWLASCLDEIDRLNAELEHYRWETNVLNDERDEARAENERLRRTDA